MPRNRRPDPAPGQVWWNANIGHAGAFAVVYEASDDSPRVRVVIVPWGYGYGTWSKRSWGNGPPDGWEIFKE